MGNKDMKSVCRHIKIEFGVTKLIVDKESKMNPRISLSWSAT